MPNPNKPLRVANPLPQTNAKGVKYPRWHSKHPNNGVVVPAVVAPTIARGN